MTGPSFASFRARVLRDTVAAMAVGILALQGAIGPEAALGFALGAGVGAVLLAIQGRAVAREARRVPPLAARRARLASLGRSGARGTALAVAFVRPELSFAWAAVGLFVGPAMLVARGATGR